MSIKKSAKTIDEAVQLALDELNVTKDDVDINVLEKPKSGFLGFGSRNALVEVVLKNKEEITICEEKVFESCCDKVVEKENSESEVAGKIKDFLLEIIEKLIHSPN